MAPRMQPTFRLALAVLIVGLVTAAVFAVGAISFRFGRKNATDLSGQVLDQTLQRIDLRIQSFLRVAVRQSRLSQRLLETGQLGRDGAEPPATPSAPASPAPTAADFGRITAHFAQAMRVHPGLTNLGIGLDATGEFCMVARKPDRLASMDYVREEDGSMRIDLYELTPTARRFEGPKPYDGYDPRRRPFYEGVVDADAARWTDAYLFFGAGGGTRTPGVTYGAPIRTADGSIVAVTHADFALQALCRFLDELRNEAPGFAFVVELRADGSQRAIAHPDPETLLHRTVAPDGRAVTTLAESIDQMGDPRARSFMALLPKRSTGDAEEKGEESAALEVEHDGERYFAAYRMLGGDDAPSWVTCMMIPRGKIMETVEKNNRTALLIGLASFLLAALLSVLVASRVSTPLSRIAAQCEKIGRFELEGPSLGRSSIAELDRLMTATDEMKASLRSFQRYVPARLVHEMSTAGIEAELGGESRTLTVYFSHVVGFAGLQAELSTEELVEQLGEHFSEVTEEIEASGGTLDKYIGDAVMAFWGAPHELEDHALRACRAALGAAEREARLHDRCVEAGRRPIHAGAGINTGDLVVGNMGSRSRLNYTVIGDAVNLAARLEGLNRVYGTKILMGARTYREVAPHVVARMVDRVAVKGKTEGIAIYELLALKEAAESGEVALVTSYGKALDAYLARRWDEAAGLFEEILAERPADGPSLVLLDRCRAYAETPPDESWDGVHVMTKK